MNAFDLFIGKYATISDEAYQDFTSIFKRKTFPKNHILVHREEAHTKCYLLEKGIASSMIFDEKGKEHIRTLFTPVSMVGSLRSLVEQRKSSSQYTCLTACVFLEANYSDLIALTKKHHDFSILYSRFLERVAIRIIDRNMDLATLNSEQRYLKLRKLAPNIENLIPLYHIAAYLNITPIQLSRVRKKLYSK